MTRKISTKKALIASIFSIVLCISMLAGTTFAWFTDSVTSAGNIIKTGTLDVEMYWADGAEAVPTAQTGWTDASEGAIFDYDNWEPGYVQVRHIKIANTGSLALKYQVNIVANGTVSDLSDAIDVYYMDPAIQVADRAMLTDSNKIGSLTDALANLGQTGNGILDAGEAVTITIALKMRDDAGNEYQGKSIGTDFSIQLLATQVAFEEDDLNDQYDSNATYPVINTTEITDAAQEQTVNVEPSNFGVSNVSVTIPGGSAAAGDVFELSVSNGKVSEDLENYTRTVSYDIELSKNNVDIDTPAGVLYPVAIQVDPGMTVVKVLHNGVEIPNFNYDPATGIITFETDSFSPFEIVFSVIPADAVVCAESAEGKKTYYNSVNDAFAAVADGSTLTLMADVAVTETLTIDSDVTVDLAGFTVSGTVGTLVKINGGNVTLKNGALANTHDKASETKYGIVVTGDAVASITDIEITVSGTGISLDGNAKVTELNAKISAYHTANGYCAYDAIDVNGNARIDLISGGEYVSFVSEAYIAEWNQTHSYSGIPSYALRINSETASVGEIRGGTFLSGDDRSNCGAIIYVNSGKLEQISGGYFGFTKFGLQSPWKVIFVNTANNASIDKITGGKFETYRNNYGCNFAGIVDASGCQIVDTGVDEEVKAQFSTSVKSYMVDVYEVTAK